mgnify:CR=1 FL=1
MKNLIKNYEYFFFDLWGVIYEGKKINRNINEIFQYIRKKKRKSSLSLIPQNLA